MPQPSSDIYREFILDLYRNPLNNSAMDRPAAKATLSNPLCGDTVTVYFQIGKNGKITKATFQGIGCAISSAASSIATEMVKGKTATQVLAIKDDEIIARLQIPISPARAKCALLCLNAMREALKAGQASGQASARKSKARVRA